MTTSMRLAAFRAAQTSEEEPEIPAPAVPDDDEDEETTTTSTKKKEASMADETTTEAALEQARTEAATAATKAANARFSAVLASEHYAGRETLAQTLLGNDKMSAEEITAALAVAPKGGTEASTTDADAAAREEMRNAISETGNSEADASGGGKGKGDKGEDPAATANLWKTAIAANNPGLKTA